MLTPLAWQRCFALTEGCGFHNLASVAFEMALTTYMERFLNLTKRLDKRKGASHSWLILQQSLTLNQVCGDLLMQLEKLDMSLSQEFLDRTAPFLQTTSERAIHQVHHGPKPLLITYFCQEQVKLGFTRACRGIK